MCRVSTYFVSLFLALSGLQHVEPPSMTTSSTQPFESLIFARQHYSGIEGQFSFHVKMDSQLESRQFTVLASHGEFAFIFGDNDGNVWRYVDANYLLQTSTTKPGTIDAIASPSPQFVFTTSTEGKLVFSYYVVGVNEQALVAVDFNRVLDDLRKSPLSIKEGPIDTYQIRTSHGVEIVVKVMKRPDAQVRVESFSLQIPKSWHVVIESISEAELPYARFIKPDDLVAAGLKVNFLGNKPSDAARDLTERAALESKENVSVARRLSDLLTRQ